MKKIAVAFVALTALMPALCTAGSAPALLAADDLLRQIFASTVSDAGGNAPEPQTMTGSCSVTRYCDYPPPAYVTCSSPAGNCILGPTYVTCDGETSLCSPPAPCDPDCDAMHGTYCNSPQTCYTGPNCEAYTCGCLNNRFLCP